METNKIEFTRIKNDTNGNPRYVCHFLSLLKTFEGQFSEVVNKDGSKMSANHVCNLVHGMDIYDWRYNIALKKAHQIGGRKYNTKSYKGGIVFQSFNIHETEKDILNLLNQ